MFLITSRGPRKKSNKYSNPVLEEALFTYTFCTTISSYTDQVCQMLIAVSGRVKEKV